MRPATTPAMANDDGAGAGVGARDSASDGKVRDFE